MGIKNPVQCYLNTFGTTLHRKKTLCNVVQEAPDNMAQEKVLCSVVLILLAQHCTGETLFNVILDAPDILHNKKSFSILS